MSTPDSPGNPITSDLAGESDMRDLVEQFIQELPGRMADLQHTLEGADLGLLARLVHQFQGAAGSYGFPQLSSQAAEIESSIQTHDDLSRISHEIRSLAELCGRVRIEPKPQ